MDPKLDTKSWILRVIKFKKKWDGDNESFCTFCKKPIKIGDEIIMVKTKKGKVYRIKFCRDNCFQAYEHRQLRLRGFY